MTHVLHMESLMLVGMSSCQSDAAECLHWAALSQVEKMRLEKCSETIKKKR